MRRRLVLVLLACVALVATSCDLHRIEPGGDGPLRYRDEVFPAVTTTSDLVYGSAPDATGAPVTLRLDVYEPSGDTLDERPAIVWVHGGGFRFGTKTSPEIVDQANVFARKGYVNVSIQYRLSATGCSASAPTADCLTAIINAKHDAQAAVRFLRANADTYGIDEGRIAIAGTSAGAITALNVGYSPDDPGSSGNPGYDSSVRSAVSLSGFALLPPDPGDAPALLFHGTADTIVPYAWAQNTIAAAEAAGVGVNSTTWEGDGHVPYVEHRTQILDETTNFLYWTLRPDQAPA